MRNFLISLSFIFIITVIWVGFNSYSAHMTEKCTAMANSLTTQSIPQGDWDNAEREFLDLRETWNKYKKIAFYFIDLKEINEIDGTMSKTHLYIKAHDISNSNGEIAYLKDKINATHQSDTIILHNIL